MAKKQTKKGQKKDVASLGNTYTKKELVAMAKKQGINPGKMTKKELILKMQEVNQTVNSKSKQAKKAKRVMAESINSGTRKLAKVVASNLDDAKRLLEEKFGEYVNSSTTRMIGKKSADGTAVYRANWSQKYKRNRRAERRKRQA